VLQNRIDDANEKALSSRQIEQRETLKNFTAQFKEGAKSLTADAPSIF